MFWVFFRIPRSADQMIWDNPDLKRFKGYKKGIQRKNLNQFYCIELQIRNGSLIVVNGGFYMKDFEIWLVVWWLSFDDHSNGDLYRLFWCWTSSYLSRTILERTNLWQIAWRQFHVPKIFGKKLWSRSYLFDLL